LRFIDFIFRRGIDHINLNPQSNPKIAGDKKSDVITSSA